MLFFSILNPVEAQTRRRPADETFAPLGNSFLIGYSGESHQQYSLIQAFHTKATQSKFSLNFNW